MFFPIVSISAYEIRPASGMASWVALTAKPLLADPAVSEGLRVVTAGHLHDWHTHTHWDTYISIKNDMYTYIYIYVNVCLCVYIYGIYIYKYVCIIYIYICVCLYVCILYIYIYDICVYVCILCIYIYIQTKYAFTHANTSYNSTSMHTIDSLSLKNNAPGLIKAISKPARWISTADIASWQPGTVMQCLLARAFAMTSRKRSAMALKR